MITCYNKEHLITGLKIASHLFDSFYPLHNHEYFEILFSEESLKQLLNGKELCSPAFTIFVLRPFKDIHELRDGAHISIKVYSDEFKNACEQLSTTLYHDLLVSEDAPMLTLSQFAATEVLQFFNNSYLLPICDAKNRSIIDRLTLLDLLKYFVLEQIDKEDLSIEQQHNTPFTIRQLKKDLQNPDNFEHTISEITENYAYSYMQLTRIFKKYTKQTLSAFFLNAKLTYATHLLIRSNYSITYIASKLGYDSASVFTKTFKNEFGLSPKDYRKKHQNSIY